MATEIEILDASFALGNVARIVAGEGGLAKVQIRSEFGTGDIYLQGAQVTAWQPAGAGEILFLSEQSQWQTGKAIRGGIPICFPWFRGKADNPLAPSHGFARTRPWQIQSIVEIEKAIAVTLVTESDQTTRLLWSYEVALTLRIELGTYLKLGLTVTNTGRVPFSFEEALHTYYRVGDVMRTEVKGLASAAYLDNRDNNTSKIQGSQTTLACATDNAYLQAPQTVELFDPVLQRRILIEKYQSYTTVVWNPWEAGAHALVDLGDEEWRQMICVEACNILSDAVALSPGQSHTMEMTLTLIDRE